MNLTEMTPAEIDALWAEALAPVRRLRETANELAATASRYRKYGGYDKQATKYEDQAKELRRQANELAHEVEGPFIDEWNARKGWTRAYVVPDGHIHRSTHCHTLYPTTLISWLPDQSGLSEKEIVKLAGVHACTVCYPSAPVEELRALEAAAKKAAQCPGSGEYVPLKPDQSYRKYRRCPHCNKSVAMTNRGVLRAHKP